jgi:pyruvate/2-oxoglutarate dehydrogenase complex dihydrolipoamide acyltransferase (E2) component
LIDFLSISNQQSQISNLHMPIDIKLPPSEGVESADIAEVYIHEGDVIEKDQAICQVETGKATLDVPAPQGGKVVKIHIKAGQSIPVGATLISLEAAGGAAAKQEKPAAAPKQEAAKPETKQPQEEAKPAPAKPQAKEQVSEEAPAPAKTAPAPMQPQKLAPAPVAAQPKATTETEDGTVAAGPAVRRFAREVGVDLRGVSGTGEGGRITRDDVLRVVREHSQGNGTKTKAAPSGQTDQWGQVHIERLPKIRKTIAAKMHESWSTVPRVTNFDDADITELERIRVSSKDDYAKKGIKLTTLPFVIKAVASALKEHPTINAAIDLENDQVIYKQYVNIGIAIDSERGLVVPSLRNANDLSIPEIARGVQELAENVRSGSFSVADLQGSTFTISNLGAIGGTYSTPIINTPEVAILLVGRSRQLPVAIDGQVEVRLMMPLSLSYDHRLVDGATAARFLNDVIGYLKAPSRLLLAP